MRKAYTKLTRQLFDENMNPTGEVEEVVFTSLIADTGKVFHCKTTGFTGGTRIDLGTEDSEENYEEVDDPNFVEVIQAIEDEVSSNV